MDYIFGYIDNPWENGTKSTNCITGLTLSNAKQNDNNKQQKQLQIQPKRMDIPKEIVLECDPAWSDSSRQEHLREPYRSVRVLPVMAHSWNNHLEWYQRMCGADELRGNGTIRCVVEVGSWFGRNTAAWAQIVGSEGQVYAVDHWKGSEEHQPGGMAHHKHLPHMYQQFLSNMIQWNLTDRVTPVSMTSLEAASCLEIQPDVIFIDGSHDYNSVLEDLEAWWPKLSSNGILCGDLWEWESVRKAVQDFMKPRNLTIELDGTQNWRIMDNRYQLQPILPRHIPYPTPKRLCAVFTMVRQEYFYLPVWYKYYSQHFTDKDIYVLHHKVNDEHDTCMTLLPDTVNKAEYDHPDWDSLRWNLEVERHYRHLLNYYECVFFTDIDEILVPNLEKYPNGLRSYLETFQQTSNEVNRKCTGIDLVQLRHNDESKSESESETKVYDPTQPILRQRHNGQYVSLYNKPMLSKKPFRFAIGFHDIKPDKMGRTLNTRVDPDLILLHLHRYDWTFYRQRHQERAKFKFSDEELKAGYCYHYREEDEQKLQKQFDEECGKNQRLPEWLIKSEIV